MAHDVDRASPGTGPDRSVVIGGSAVRYSDASEVPQDMAVEMGRALGISPIAYLGSPRGFPPVDPVDQLVPLVEAAALLGYRGVDAEGLLSRLAEVQGDVATPLADTTVFVALVPDPTSHRAAPPGERWFCHFESLGTDTADMPGRSTGLGCDRWGWAVDLRWPHVDPRRPGAVVVDQRRNRTSRVSSVLLWDDPVADLAHRSAVEAGAAMAILLDTVGHVAGLDSGTLLVELPTDGGPGASRSSRTGLVTPPLGDGAIDTVWRRTSIRSGEVVERTLDPEDLMDADRLVCVYPWGDRVTVELA